MTEPPGGWRAGMLSGQWKIRWVGSTRDSASDRVSGRLPGRPARGASPLGRGGAAPQEPQSETETWAGPGDRAAGRLGRVLPRAPPRWPPQPPPLRQKPPPTRGPRARPPETAETEATEGRTVPGGWAQQPQGLGERPPRIPRPVRETPPGPGRHIPRRTPPREHASDRRLSRCRCLCWCRCRCRGCLRRRLSQSLRYSQQPPPTAAESSSAQARAPPTPRTRPRPARLSGCRRAGARALTSHAPYRLREPASLLSQPPHVTPPESNAGACAGTPHSSSPGGPAQTFLPHLTAELGTVPQNLTPVEKMSQGWGRKLWVCDCSSRFPANTEVPEGWLGW